MSCCSYLSFLSQNELKPFWLFIAVVSLLSPKNDANNFEACIFALLFHSVFECLWLLTHTHVSIWFKTFDRVSKCSRWHSAPGFIFIDFYSDMMWNYVHIFSYVDHFNSLHRKEESKIVISIGIVYVSSTIYSMLCTVQSFCNAINIVYKIGICH